MVNRPFRVAFWALAINLGLSLCWLSSDPESARLALHIRPISGPQPEEIEPRPVLLAQSATRPNAAAATATGDSSVGAVASPESNRDEPVVVETVPATGRAPDTNNEPVTIADNGSRPPPIRRPLPETPPLPIREVSTNNEAGYPWILHDASRTSFGTGKFEELPPPPEFADEASVADADAAHPADTREMATQLTGLAQQLDNLHGELSELRTSHAAVERTLTELVTLSETSSAKRSSSPVEIRAVVVEAPLTGVLRDGVLPALQRSGAAGDVSIGDESWRNVSWGVCRCESHVITGWLQNAATTGRMAQQTLRLSPGATGPLDLWRMLPPRMVQARGTFVFERAPRPEWGGGLELRCLASEPVSMELEFRTGGTAGRGSATPSDWQLTSVPSGGTLIITGRCQDPGRLTSADGDATLTHDAAPGSNEIVVIISPRPIVRDSESVAEPALVPPVAEAPQFHTSDK